MYYGKLYYIVNGELFFLSSSSSSLFSGIEATGHAFIVFASTLIPYRQQTLVHPFQDVLHLRSPTPHIFCFLHVPLDHLSHSDVSASAKCLHLLHMSTLGSFVILTNRLSSLSSTSGLVWCRY